MSKIVLLCLVNAIGEVVVTIINVKVSFMVIVFPLTVTRRDSIF